MKRFFVIGVASTLGLLVFVPEIAVALVLFALLAPIVMFVRWPGEVWRSMNEKFYDDRGGHSPAREQSGHSANNLIVMTAAGHKVAKRGHQLWRQTTPSVTCRA